LQPLVEVEFALREGQCHDALDSLRLAIKTFNANYKFKQDNVRGQFQNTRAQHFLNTLNNDKVSALDKYNQCRNVLLNLGLSPVDKTLQSLAKSQLWGRNMGLPAELGDTKTDEPWFWVVGRPSGLSKEEEVNWNYEGWFKTSRSIQSNLSVLVNRACFLRFWAVMERGREEKEILEEEILRVHTSFSKMTATWTGRTQHHRVLLPTPTSKLR
ncbi:hypothetical protein BDN72DRAFT_776639, partial [Pluteus cervinus]